MTDGVRLERGGHAHAEAGSCLMERVSIIAGEPFTDRPRCAHPALAALAQQVNDRVSDEARQALLRLAPGLATSATDDPRASWALVAVCARHVLERRPGDVLAARLLRRASRGQRHWSRLRLRGLPARLAGLRALPELAVAFHRAAALSGPSGSAERDAALVALLEAAVTTVTRPDHASVSPGVSVSPDVRCSTWKTASSSS
ncbi:hypothetical protein LQ327_26205 [Actinomycetospora endophytica]|uniref:Lantibiotic biosynthesis dehydratase-like protein n=1 Tax=Actinomycetospora endophytica TaxID=2291215 RepID=A0ABS8PF30_9PSEU|nr:hypothetical protein [Actinomycetospora endophytica]MCD2196868.1 hypothetical protein [Actinomycetospora endophytica]